jgi:hypothetical protein
MKTFTVCFVLFAQSAFALIGENEKQLEATYGHPKRSRTAAGGRVDTYIAHGYAINVHFIGGISTTEWFEPLGKSPFTKEDVKRILELSAEKGQTWRSKRTQPKLANWANWMRSDDKVMAVSSPRIVQTQLVKL